MNKKLLYSWLVIMILAQLIGGYLAGSTPQQYALGLLSVAYVFLVTLASRWNFVVGAVLATCFAIIAMQSHVYGDALYQLTTVGINIFGVIAFVILSGQNRMRMILFSTKEWMCIILGAVASFIVLLFILPLLGDPLAVKDALVFSVGLVAIYALARGYKYNFILWILSNTVQVVLWLSTASYSEHGLSMALNYGVFLGNSIVGLVNWIMISKGGQQHERN